MHLLYIFTTLEYHDPAWRVEHLAMKYMEFPSSTPNLIILIQTQPSFHPLLLLLALPVLALPFFSADYLHSLHWLR